MCEPVENKQLSIRTLKNRSDFLRVAKQNKKWISSSMVVQISPSLYNKHQQISDIRVGFTASKKVGNAVLRNKAKRRLREVVRHVMTTEGKENYDYVIIARDVATLNPFNQLIRDMKWSLKRLHDSLDQNERI